VLLIEENAESGLLTPRRDASVQSSMRHGLPQDDHADGVPNVKDEPRRERARLVQQNELTSAASFRIV